MATEERDHTADWIVPAERRPPSAFELQRQIEVATAVARAAEEAAMEIGQASLEAAEQARLAATHAERSAEASVAAARAVAGRGEPVVAEAEQAPAPIEAVVGHEEIPGSELPVAWSPVAGSGPAAPAPARPKPSGAISNLPADPRLRDFVNRAERVDRRLLLILGTERRTEAAAGRVRDFRTQPTPP